jgi:aldose 1-epimerase
VVITNLSGGLTVSIQTYAKESDYQGEAAILLGYGPYSAVMLPRIGGNLISFRDEVNNYAILREPTAEEWPSFVQSPMIHGIPVLFPPNRYEDGEFTFNDKKYSFPINEPLTNNHLHGFVYNVPWDIVEYGCNDDKSWVSVRIRFDQDHPNFTYFPHAFTLTNTYTLNAQGLTQHFHAVNDGNEALPFMLGFHTAVNAPFAPGSTSEDLACLVTIGDRWEMTERMLPTDKFQPLNESEQLLKNGSGDPYAVDMDNHYTAAPQNGLNQMALTDNKAKKRLVYNAGLKYKQWMIWNNQSNGAYFCPEPQTNQVNAPNSSLPSEQNGLIALEPGQEWFETSTMFIESL